MANTANTMPYNRDAEMALLGCFLIDNEVAVDLIESLRELDFYQDSHKTILSAMKGVYKNRKPIDIVTVADLLDSEGKLSKIGGIAYLTELAEITPSAANYKSYYDIVKRDSVNRQLIRASRSIIEKCGENPEGQDSVAYAEKQVYDISMQSDRSTLSKIGAEGTVDSVIEKFEKLQSDPDAFRGVETGFKHFDRMTNGLQPSDLIVLAARPGMGKTSLAMNIVEHAAMRKDKVCAVFSLEMPRIQIAQRLMCSYANVSMSRALRGNLTASDWKKLMIAADKMKKSRIYIDASSVVTPQEILSKCRRLKAQEGQLDLIMIDYIQLMSSGDSKLSGKENRQQEISSITRDLKIMAKELNVPVLALSQLKRLDSKVKEPTLSDLRESGAIEQDADIVMFINRDDYLASEEDIQAGRVIKGAASLKLEKHRNGEPGRVKLRFIGESTKFVDVDEQNREEEAPSYEPVTEYDDTDYSEEAPDDYLDAGYAAEQAFKTAREKNESAEVEEIPFE
ncbi:MAG: replicative DNA helicase [Clostridia bacterium]|nr:replicative DNA helicase [Clostridia bacterium]